MPSAEPNEKKNMPASAVRPGEQTYTNIPTPRILLWIAIVSMIMLFAGLTSAYIVRQAEGNWVHFELPRIFFVSTALLLASSFSMHFGLASVRAGRQGGLVTGLIVTLGLGLAFAFSQFLGWTRLVERGIFLVGNPSGSFLYVLTGLHLAHLAGGILYLLYAITGSLRHRYTADSHLQVRLCATYWHFLDILWIYLFIFLLLIR
jgi:cytochrome c oxidase subunit 3